MRAAYVIAAYTKQATALTDVLREALLASGFDRVLPEQMRFVFPDELAQLNHYGIRQASVVIAVVADQNPQTYLEIGYALGIGKPVLIVTDPGLVLPFDLANVALISSAGGVQETVDEAMKALERMRLRPVETDAMPRTSEQELQSYHNDPGYFEQIDPQHFEGLVAEFLAQRGFHVNAATGRNDGGFDLEIAAYKHLGHAIVEVKKYGRHSRVSAGQVQQLMGAVYASGAQCGILVSSAEFTRSAREFAEQCHPRIELWTMEDLLAMREDVQAR